MNAIEIKSLSKSFKGMYALNDFNMTVPVGSIYGFIGENGSGKSTTLKLICGHLVKNSGEIKLFDKDESDPGVRARVGALIENAGCFPNSSIYDNLMMQCINLGITNKEDEINRVLDIVRMSEHKNLKFKRCSLGMKQRVGIAMALLNNPLLLLLDEPINGLDTDGMKIVREILVDIVNNYHTTIVISSHILGELEKIATHYGIVRQGKMIKEITQEEMKNRAQVFTTLKTLDNNTCYSILTKKYTNVKLIDDYIKIYDIDDTEEIVKYLIDNKVDIIELKKNKIGLEEYYLEVMKEEI